VRSTDLLARMRLDSSQFDKSLNQSQTTLQQFARTSAALPGGRGSLFSQLAADAATLTPLIGSLPLGIAAVGASVVALGVSAQRSGQAFEFALTRIQTLGADAQQNLTAVRDGILDTFRNTPLAESLTDVVEANYELQSSGRSAAESIKDTRVAAQAAVAGFTTTRVAVDGITTATNAWKGSIDDAEQASDILFVGVNRGKVRFDELAASIGNVAPTASALGVSFQETVGAIAALSLQGVRTSTAVEGLRSALINIQAPTEGFKRDYRALAEDFDASRLARDGFLKFLTDFDRDSGGSRDALKALFSDTTAFNTALGLLSEGGRVYQSVLADMATASGSTQQAFDLVNGSSEAQERLIRNRLTAAWTEFGESLNAGVLPVLQAVASILERINSAPTTPGANAINRQVAAASAFLDDALGFTLINKLLVSDVATPFRPSGGGPGRNGLGLDSALSGPTLGSALQNLNGIDLTTGGAIPTPARAQPAKPLTAEQKAAVKAAESERKKIRDEAAKLLTELDDVTTRALDGVAGALRRTIGKTVEEVQALLASDQISAATKAGLQSRLNSFTALQGELLDAQQDATTTAAVLAQAEQEEQSRALERISVREQDLVLKKSETKNLEAQALLEKQLLELGRARAALTGDVFALPDSIDQAKESSDGLRTAIFGAVDGAIALADAFGGVSNETRRTLQNLSLIGRSFSEYRKAQRDATTNNTALGGAARLTAAASAASGLLSLVAGIGSAFDARKDEQRRNTQALRDLTLKIGDLATTSLSGDTLSRISRVVSDPQRFLNSLRVGTRIIDQPAEIARQAGVALSDVQAVLDEFNITFDRDLASIANLSNALKQADLNAYIGSVTGSLQRFQDSLTADGITDPLEILTRRIAALTQGKTGFPALASALEGLDLSSVEGRATALDRTRALFSQVQNGTLGLDQFGGFSISDARQQLLDLISGLRESVTGGSTGTGGFNETRTITEVTGSRLVSYLSYLPQIAADIRAIAAAFQIPTLPSFVTPSIGSFAGSAGSAAFTIAALTINVTLTRELLGVDAGQTIDRANTFGRALGGSMISEIDRQLRERQLREKIYHGDNRIVQ
jgi:TP901 family phage tail tape measure protein